MAFFQYRERTDAKVRTSVATAAEADATAADGLMILDGLVRAVAEKRGLDVEGGMARRPGDLAARVDGLHSAGCPFRHAGLKMEFPAWFLGG